MHLRHEFSGEHAVLAIFDLEHARVACFEGSSFRALVDGRHASLALGDVHLSEVAFADLDVVFAFLEAPGGVRCTNEMDGASSSVDRASSAVTEDVEDGGSIDSVLYSSTHALACLFDVSCLHNIF